ncbi:ParB/RepB/Spo0J family partition protein [Candidatus Saccharibacteria bacterium]|nr:ParB/RepB/Spo0J family partition protein [Candidatus Saccharibacteria bacterium]
MSGFGLGKGFDSLIPTDLVEEDFDPTAGEDEKVSRLIELKVSEIVPDLEQPRRDFDEDALKALADSIKEQGVLQPIVVVKRGDKYQIVAGERRWRAAKMAKLMTIPAIVRTLDAQNRLELSIIENAQREDLNAIELATAYAKLKSQFNLDEAGIAQRIGKSKASVVGTMRLLNLPDDAKRAMREHNLSEGVMRPLVSAEREVIDEVLPKIIEDGWSARQVERYVASRKKKSSVVAVKTDKYIRQEETLSKKYAAKVAITGRTVKISCKNAKDLEVLLGKLM